MARFVPGCRVVTWELHEMDCRLAMGMLMDADSIDSVVCDPPYGLSKEPKMDEVLRHWLNGDDYVHGGAGFMLKDWDSFVPGPSVWREAYRVLKPGGHLVAFFGTRTYDLGVLALRLAGFEIRDQLAWVFGSGFPKSHDVSKGIDKLDAADVRRDRALRFTAWIRSQGISSSQIDAVTGTNMGSHYTTAASQPAIATREHFERIRHMFREVPPVWLELMVDERTVESENFNRREVTSEKPAFGIGGNGVLNGHSDGATAKIYAGASTEDGRKWQGWGTALKPAYEPIVLARKPLGAGTVARNVLTHGTGALNIDGCRVRTSDTLGGGMVSMGRPKAGEGWDRPWMHDREITEAKKIESANKVAHAQSLGRWPANLAHDGSPEVLAEFPVTTSGKMKAGTVRAAREEPGSVCYGTFGGRATDNDTPGDSGSAARFFKSCPIDDEDAEAARLYYCAKASKSDRNAGLDDLPEQPSAASEFRPNHTEGAANGEDGNPYGRWSPVRNTHPTVKPTALMQWLVRLVTPPGGLVLDPFTGSGSTGKAAMLEGFSFVGCEMDPDYAKIARLRIDHAVNSR